MSLKLISNLVKFLIFFIFSSCVSNLSDEELNLKFNESFKNEKWEKADNYIDEIIFRNPKNVENYLKRAIINSYLSERNNQNIIKDLNIYLKKYPNNYPIKVFRIQTNFLNENFTLALREIDELIEIKGKSSFLLTWKGNISFSQKKFSIAEQAYKECLYFSLPKDELQIIYHYWVLSKYFGGNKEGALWDLAFLEQRGLKSNWELLEAIEKDKLNFDDYTNFMVPESKFSDINKFLNSYCSDLDIFEDGQLYRSSFLSKFFYLKKTNDLNSIIEKKDSIYALNLENYGLKEIPDILFEFKNLQYLNLSYNRFKNNEQLFEDLSKFPNLIALELHRCYLRYLPDNIKNLNNLQVLSLQFNDFRTLNENLGELISLKYLDIGSNGKLRELPKSIGELKCLQYLNISPNGLNKLRNELSGCHQLKSIVANAGRIKTLPENMGGLVNLKYINLASNKITSLPETLGEMSSLEHLSLGSNDIKVIPKSLSSLKKLDFLDIAYNRLNEFPSEVLGLDKCVNLWIHNNKIPTVPKEIGNMKSLTHLLIDHEIISDKNINEIKEVNPNLRVIREDTRKYAKGPKRK